MHYTAMAATYFVPLGIEVQMSKPIFSQDFLAYSIAGGMVLLSVGNLSLLTLIRESLSRMNKFASCRTRFRRLEHSAPLVAEVFYRRLFEIAPHLRQRFPADLTHQGAKFMAMLSIVVANLDNLEEITPVIEDLGRRHVAYGAAVDDYKVVGQALMWTLEQGLREEFTPDVRAAWLAAYAALANVMTSGAAGLRGNTDDLALTASWHQHAA